VSDQDDGADDGRVVVVPIYASRRLRSLGETISRGFGRPIHDAPLE
jgi:hypothetical protein